MVIKPNFCSDFEHKVCSRFWCWSSGKIFKLEFGHYFASDILQRLRSWILIEMLKLGSVNILNFKFSRDGDVWLRFWSKCLVEILKMKFDQDLCLNLWYDPIGYFGKMNSTLGSVVPLAIFENAVLEDEPRTFWVIIVPEIFEILWKSSFWSAYNNLCYYQAQSKSTVYKVK